MKSNSKLNMLSKQNAHSPVKFRRDYAPILLTFNRNLHIQREKYADQRVNPYRVLNTIIANSTSCIGILKLMQPSGAAAGGVHSLSSHKYGFIAVGRKIF